jgi:uncharacterized protein YoxC
MIYLVGIITLCVVLSTFYFIKTLKKSIKTLNILENFIEETKDEIRPAISKIHTSVEEIKNITENIDEKLKKTDTIFEIIEKLSGNLQIPANLAGELTEKGVIKLYSLLYGLKKGLQKFYELNKK